MTVQHLPTPKTTATLSLSGPAPGQATAQTGRLPGKCILKATIIPEVDGAVRVIAMQIITPASTIMEIQVAGIGTMVLDSGIPAPTTGDIGMMPNTIHIGKKVMLTATGWYTTL